MLLLLLLWLLLLLLDAVVVMVIVVIDVVVVDCGVMSKKLIPVLSVGSQGLMVCSTKYMWI